jgi:2Fe-2S ferredoxin
MPKITFLATKIVPEEKTIEVNAGTTLLDAAQQIGVPMGHSCGGVCGCSTCHVYIKSGGENLSDQEDREADRLDMAFQVRPNSRLGCQSEVQRGHVIVEITPESLKAYLDENPKLRKELEAQDK